MTLVVIGLKAEKAKKKEARCVTPGFLLFDHEDRTATTSR